MRINLLYDFYGQLLTAKQRALLKLYYQADLSLGEIADQQEVSRQAVYDILKRSERTLEHFEDKLNLVEKHLATRNLFSELEHELTKLQADLIRMAEQSSSEAVADADEHVKVGELKAAASKIGDIARRLQALD